MFLAQIFLCLLVAAASSASILDHYSAHADVVIIGGGIAGFVLANRLSEDSHLSVHLFDAGPDPTCDTIVSTPAFAGLLSGTQYNWNLTTTPQPVLDHATVIAEQGHALGGGSTVNYMSHGRGAASVFDEWAEITHDEG
jgi:choline dehydrogenase